MNRLALCLLLLATGASAAALPEGAGTFHDDENGARCWYVVGGLGNIALDCIPDSQLKAPNCGPGTDWSCDARNERQLSPHETQPEPTPALAPGRWIDERYEL